MREETSRGSLVCVGTGIQLAGQITLIAKSYIEEADIVFGVLPDPIAESWISELNSNFVSLQNLYSEDRSRKETYKDMVSAIVNEVKSGKKVVGAFYGHPGVFAWAPHEAIRQLQALGYDAFMEPGISAEDCLFADLGIDPGASGCQGYETTQFLFYKHDLDLYSYVILWQIGLAGEWTLQSFSTSRSNLEKTVSYLNRWYPLSHEVIIYEAPFLPTQEARIERFPLSSLPDKELSMSSTMVIPPLHKLELDEEGLKHFGLTVESYKNTTEC
ncbi:SAM-dependent methyltransferase [Kangiella aquimarina]|uniref:SAM-dependent methyltransferase n=1 Tax=Kangiella aquimarina TaxID=261965 RepID=A0ABZ0X404_9GAMM|nr:SAM-dependent methyltransferase [Kangiella aquimarina]WQG85327.1 SAM-dependent methyltransferase [Kangiella aquimarina]